MKNALRLVAAASLAGSIALAAPASAAPVIYNLTLTGVTNVGVSGGTGSFSIDGSTFSKSGNEYFQYTGSPSGDLLLSLSFTIDGHTFDKSDSGGNGDQVFFQNGVLKSITYSAVDGGNILISLNAGALTYTYSNYTNGHTSIGNITAVAAPVASPVPEPVSWAMMVLGVGTVGFALRRRSRTRVRISYAA